MRIFAFILICLIANIGCSSSQDTREIELATCKKALKYIAEKDYNSLKNLFPDEFSQRLNDSVFRYQVEAGAEMIRVHGMPDEKDVTKQNSGIPVFNPTEGVDKIKTVSGSSYMFPFPAGQEKPTQYISFMFFGGNPKWISSMTIMNEALLNDFFKKMDAAEGRTKKPFRKTLEFNPNELITVDIYYSGDSERKELFVNGKLKQFEKLGLKKDFSEFLKQLGKAKILKTKHQNYELPFEEEKQVIRIGCEFSNKDSTYFEVYAHIGNNSNDSEHAGFIIVDELDEQLNLIYFLDEKENAALVEIMKKLSIERYDALKPFSVE